MNISIRHFVLKLLLLLPLFNGVSCLDDGTGASFDALPLLSLMTLESWNLKPVLCTHVLYIYIYCFYLYSFCYGC